MRVLFILSLLVASGCSPTDLLVGTVLDGGGEAGPSECHADSECDGGYCSRFSCEHDAGGACVPQPTSCFNENALLRPVCGCDGVTYWNACVMAVYGASLHDGTDQCRGDFAAGCTLTDKSKCRIPSAMECSVELLNHPGAPVCSATYGIASCWALPPDGCDGNTDTHVVACPVGQGGGHPVCTDRCTAILSQQPYQSAFGSCHDGGP